MTATITERPTQTVETTAAATVLAAITMGVGIYAGVNLLQAR